MKIRITHDSTGMFNHLADDPAFGVNREATVESYHASLEQHLIDTFAAEAVEIIDQQTLTTRIEIDPEPEAYATLNGLLTAIQSAMEEHYTRGDFWVERDA